MRFWPRRAEAAWLLAAVLAAGCRPDGGEPGLRVTELQVFRGQDSVMLQPELDLQLSPAVLDALHNGVPVVLVLEARLERQRAWLWPRTVPGGARRYILTYHSLGDQYLMRDEDDETPRAFPSRDAVLATLESPEPWSLVLPADAPEDTAWRAALRVRLDLEALPAPLRLAALFSPGWRIGSGWHRETLPP